MNVVDAAEQGGQDGAGQRQPRRVREDVRDGVAVIAFSAVASSLAAVALMLLTRLVG